MTSPVERQDGNFRTLEDSLFETDWGILLKQMRCLQWPLCGSIESKMLIRAMESAVNPATFPERESTLIREGFFLSA
jgi:hypothetical protein